MFRVNSVGKLNLANLLAPAVGLQELWKYQRQCTGTKKKIKKHGYSVLYGVMKRDLIHELRLD